MGTRKPRLQRPPRDKDMLVARLRSTACFALTSQDVPAAPVSNVARTPAPDVQNNYVNLIIQLYWLCFPRVYDGGYSNRSPSGRGPVAGVRPARTVGSANASTAWSNSKT